MFHATFNRLYPLRSYEEAKRKYESTKPIRGRSDENKRPLGDRSAVDKAYIRKNGEAYECYLYQTPVVTFHPDNSIVLDIGTRYKPSQSDAKFIEALLRLRTRIHKKALLVGINGQMMTFTTENHSAVLRSTPQGIQADERVIMGYKLNRKAANNVRRRYGAFYRWLKATVSLRSESRVQYQNTEHEHILTRVVVPATEMAQVLKPAPFVPSTPSALSILGGTSTDKYICFATSMLIGAKPAAGHMHRQLWDIEMQQFINLISPAEPDTYYEAFLRLVYVCSESWAYGMFGGWGGAGLPFLAKDIEKRAFHCNAKMPAKTLDTLLFSYFAEEVLESVPLRPGEVPKEEYARWMK